MAGMIIPNAEHFFSAAGAVLEIMEVGVNGRDGLGTQGPQGPIHHNGTLTWRLSL